MTVPKTLNGRPAKYPFRSLREGESFDWDLSPSEIDAATEMSNLRSAISQTKRRIGGDFTYRRDGLKVRVWCRVPVDPEHWVEPVNLDLPPN